MDVMITNHFSLIAFKPLTDAARDWIAEHVVGETSWFGDALMVEPRYAGALIEGMVNDGLEVN